MRIRTKFLLAVAMLLALTMSLSTRLLASDHADTAENVNRITTDLTDVFIFPSPERPHYVVLVMNQWGLIPTGQAGFASFDPGVLYQFKIDNTGDFVEDLVIQARFIGSGPAQNQRVLIAGPCKPDRTGTVTTFMSRCLLKAAVDSASQHPRSIIQVKKPPKGGTAGHPTRLGFPVNKVITLRDGMRIFTGPRRSVLLRLGAVLPDPAGPHDALDRQANRLF